MPRALKAHIFERDDHDHYVESFWVSRRLLETEEFGDTIADPACGWGRILKSAADLGKQVAGSDIIDRRLPDVFPKSASFKMLDFVAVHTDATYKWWRHGDPDIVSNPPFNQIRDFAERAIAVVSPGRKVALVSPVRRLPAARWLAAMGIQKLLFLSPRPSMPTGQYILDGGKVGGGKEDFCWLIFQKGYTGSPTFGWLHRDA